MNAALLDAVHAQLAVVAIETVNSAPAATTAAGASPTVNVQFATGVVVGVGAVGEDLSQPTDAAAANARAVRAMSNLR